MKEERYFLVPYAAEHDSLPEDEAAHALKALRMKEGDEMVLIDGRGSFHRARLIRVDSKICRYEILETVPQPKGWRGRIHLAVAPTKNIDRVEWMAEKITEVGFDEMTFLDCRNSERRKVRTDRIMRIVISAVKQSRKPYIPVVNPVTPFADFVRQRRPGRKFICHCHEDIERKELQDELVAMKDEGEVTILIGPEGDFSREEVEEAVKCGYESAALGTFRLRTETAGVMAVSMFSLAGRFKRPG